MSLKITIGVIMVIFLSMLNSVHAKEVVNQQTVIVTLESTEAIKDRSDIQWLFARIPGTNIRVVGKVKITQMLGSQDTLSTVQWLGVQDYQKPKRIAQFEKPIKMQWLSHRKTFLKNQKLQLKKSPELQEAIIRLHNKDTISFDLSKGTLDDSVHNQLKRWVKGWLNMESDSEFVDNAVFNEESQKDIHQNFALKVTTTHLED